MWIIDKCIFRIEVDGRSRREGRDKVEGRRVRGLYGGRIDRWYLVEGYSGRLLVVCIELFLTRELESFLVNYYS